MGGLAAIVGFLTIAVVLVMGGSPMAGELLVLLIAAGFIGMVVWAIHDSIVGYPRDPHHAEKMKKLDKDMFEYKYFKEQREKDEQRRAERRAGENKDKKK